MMKMMQIQAILNGSQCVENVTFVFPACSDVANGGRGRPSVLIERLRKDDVTPKLKDKSTNIPHSGVSVCNH